MKEFDAPNFVFISLSCFGYLSFFFFLVGPYKHQNFSISVKNAIGIDRDCNEFVYYFGLLGHFNNINSFKS